MAIPDVDFNHKQAAYQEVQILDLNLLNQRKHQLDQDPTLPHRIGFYHLIYINKGQGLHRIDFDLCPFRGGDFIFVRKNQVNAFDFSACPEGRIVLFTQRFIDQISLQMRLPDIFTSYPGNSLSTLLSPEPDLCISIKGLLTELEQELTHPEANFQIVMHLFSVIFLMLYRVSSQSTSQGPISKEQQHRFQRFIAALEQQCHYNRDASKYASQLHCTYKTLNLLCKQATGQTAKQLIDSFTVLEAKRRLVIDRISTQQLAYDLSFEDASNFVKYFKKHTGYTPADFQKRFSHYQ